MRYSDFIVFADETGSDTLATVDPAFPVFGMAFCVFEKTHYARSVIPRMTELKFKHFGHDQIVLHEYDIRRRRQPFRFPPGGAEEGFLADIANLISESEVTVVVVLVDKRRVPSELAAWVDLVGLVAERGLLCVSEALPRGANHEGPDALHVVVESRGAQDDQRLKEAFRRVNQLSAERDNPPNLRPVVAEKARNSSGLQIADLIAHPVARHFLEPNQPNRAWEVIKGKMVGGQGLDKIVLVPEEK